MKMTVVKWDAGWELAKTKAGPTSLGFVSGFRQRAQMPAECLNFASLRMTSFEKPVRCRRYKRTGAPCHCGALLRLTGEAPVPNVGSVPASRSELPEEAILHRECVLCQDGRGRPSLDRQSHAQKCARHTNQCTPRAGATIRLSLTQISARMAARESAAACTDVRGTGIVRPSHGIPRSGLFP
jgi:hypothetical protein